MWCVLKASRHIRYGVRDGTRFWESFIYENLFFASSKMRIYVKEGSNVPVQYYTTFSEGNKSLGYGLIASVSIPVILGGLMLMLLLMFGF